ncbi:class I SAM-dependent methyltransferase [Oxalobacter sp. OttesenSCG-928-P03]|nr:class I SAM-dependent methyltransferase [Oxalobacter sp. OttesenSCG-928-P03]
MTAAKDKNRQIWDARYGQPGYFYGTAPNAWLASKEGYLKAGMRVLLPADGEGRNSVWCAERGMAVDAFELSAVAVEKAKQLAAKRGVSVNHAVADIGGWDWQPEVYDAVILVFMNFATPNMRRRLFADCIKTLRPGGILLLQGYSVRQLEYGTGGPSVPEQLYTEEMLANAFAALDILEMTVYDTELSEGQGHNGMSAVISMVARKPD